MTPDEIHNKIAPEIVKRIIKEIGSEEYAFVVLESVILGVMLFYEPDPRKAGEFLDIMTMAVIERMGKKPCPAS